MRIEFSAPGPPRVVARAIEEYARADGRVHALVVPWESDERTLNMAVTAVKADGWAIEHTNLGTITLTDAGHDATRVAVDAPEPRTAAEPKLTAILDRFGRQLQSRLAAEP
jgi:hypothetical protein